MSKTERVLHAEEVLFLHKEATPAPWCTHPSGLSVWSGEQYDSSDESQKHLFNRSMVRKGDRTSVDEVADKGNLAPCLRTCNESYINVVDTDLVAVYRNLAPSIAEGYLSLLRAAKELFAALDHTCPDWRERTILGDPVNNDEVNRAWIDLAKELGEVLPISNQDVVMKMASPRNPIRDVLQAMTGLRPPTFVKGYSFKNLTDDQHQELQDWCAQNVRPAWLTGIGLMDAAESQVHEAVSNGNIPPEEKGSK